MPPDTVPEKGEVEKLVAELKHGALAYMSASGPVYEGPTVLERKTADALTALSERLDEAERVIDGADEIIARLERDYAIQHTMYDGRPVEAWARRTATFRGETAALASAGKVAEGWKPIDTAPKTHGHLILGANASGSVKIICWHMIHTSWDSGDYSGDDGFVPFEATHWQPLPAAPSPETEG